MTERNRRWTRTKTRTGFGASFQNGSDWNHSSLQLGVCCLILFPFNCPGLLSSNLLHVLLFVVLFCSFLAVFFQIKLCKELWKEQKESKNGNPLPVTLLSLWLSLRPEPIDTKYCWTPSSDLHVGIDFSSLKMFRWVFLWASQVALVAKNLPANAGNAGSIPGWGRSLGIANGNPLQYSCLKNFMDRGAWQATVHEVEKSQTWLSTYMVFCSPWPSRLKGRDSFPPVYD